MAEPTKVLFCWKYQEILRTNRTTEVTLTKKMTEDKTKLASKRQKHKRKKIYSYEA